MIFSLIYAENRKDRYEEDFCRIVYCSHYIHVCSG